MSFFIFDVESDGPCPHLYSMVSFGLVKLDDLSQTFYGKTAPISDDWIPEALAISNTTREQHLKYPDPYNTMRDLCEWVSKVNTHGRPTLISDNPAFDWQFMNYYLHNFTGNNPFGFSARRIGDIYAGHKGKFKDATSWKKYRKTKHTHNPVDDSVGNAEALLHILKRMGDTNYV